MNVEYTGRHTTVTSKLRGQAEGALARIAPMLDRSASAHVILTEDKYRRIAEITLTASHEDIVANAEANDMEAALHAALHKLEQQVVKHKEKFETLSRHPKHAIVDELEEQAATLEA